MKELFFYTKCSTLPMPVFIGVVVHGDFKSLCKYFFLKLLLKSKAQEIWESIFEEYTDLMKSNQTNITFQLVRDVHFMWNKINMIEKTVDSLKLRYNEKLFDILRDMGYCFAFTRESYIGDLKKVITRTKGIVHQLALANQELAGLDKGDDTVKESDYFDMCYAISKGLISLNKITVSEFCAAYNAHKREMELTNVRNRS